MAAATTVCILIGGLAEIVPMFDAKLGPQPIEGVEPYSPLELAGRDIYLREGCYNCHSQMIRPFRAETLRYGPWTRAGEYAYDHPFQLGSRRIGPDIQREGGKYSDRWHYEHMKDPRSTSPGSIMPPYPWLYDAKVDPADVQASVDAMRMIGVPYPEDLDVAGELKKEQQAIADNLKSLQVTDVQPDSEIVALIAYMQQLGVAGKAAALASEGK